jgi:hypothetical protein
MSYVNDQPVEDPAVEPTIAEIMAAPGSHDEPVCRHGDMQGRYNHVMPRCRIMELTTAPRLNVAPGAPCHTRFQTFSLLGQAT